jgi:hypothetical protein
LNGAKEQLEFSLVLNSYKKSMIREAKKKTEKKKNSDRIVEESAI